MALAGVTMSQIESKCRAQGLRLTGQRRLIARCSPRPEIIPMSPSCIAVWLNGIDVCRSRQFTEP